MIGKQLGQYKILAEIGRGGMGIVYKAYQISLNREVALKVLPSQLAADESLVKRFHREAEAAARLSHPNIVQIFDINEIDGIHFFAMEYLKGETLTQKIEREGPLSLKEAVRLAMMVADALNYSHSEGIIHRDIKPGNIMIDPQGHVKVTDFGLARAIESSRLTMTGTIIGTPEYMSPEQARGETLDGRSDLYSLGMVLYEMVTGRIPFEATTPFAIAQKQIYESIPSPCSIRPEIPSSLEAIIFKTTQKDPGDRYQRGDELKNDLEFFLLGKDLERITPTVTVPPERPQPLEEAKIPGGLIKRIRWGRVALAIVLFIVLVSFLSKMKTKPSPPLPPSPPPQIAAEDESKKMIEEARRLLDRGSYAEAVSKLEEVLKKFPGHSQANLIEQWISEARDKEKEAQDKEAANRFKEAETLVSQGATVKAILKFNEIARDYPGTGWEKIAGEKVAELEKVLKEGEAKKEFLEAQDLERKNNFIEATQLYQSIINRYPGTVWAKKSEDEIASLKERQARLRERAIGPSEGGEREGSPFRFREEIDSLVRSDKEIMHFMIDEDSKGLTKYFLEKYPDRIKAWAEEAGLSAEAFALDLSQKMIEGMKREMGQPRGEPPPMRQESRPGLRPQVMEEVKKILEDMKAADPDIEKLIEKGDRRNLAEYLWQKHEADLKNIAKAMKITAGKIDRVFSFKIAAYLMKQEEMSLGTEPGVTQAGPPRGRGERGGDFRRGRETGDRELRDKVFNKFRDLVRSDERVAAYIERGEVESLTAYVTDNYYDEMDEMSQELDRPMRDLAWEFSDRLVNEERSRYE